MCLTDQEPTLHGYDCIGNRAFPPKLVSSLPPSISDSYCTGHQQQIACMAFSHSSMVLATGSWDSTCMLWRVPKRPKLTDSLTQVHAESLTLIRMLPVDDSGVMCLAFTQDDSNLVACGECQIKVWSVDDDSGNQPPESLVDQLTSWEDAIPFSFSVEYSLRLAEFDESVAALVSNHAWISSITNGRLGLVPSTSAALLQAPPRTCVAYISDEQVADHIAKCLECIVESVEAAEPVPGSHPSSQEDDRDDKSAEKKDSEANQDSDPLLGEYTRAQLREEFKQMDHFHFQQLLDPSSGVSGSALDGSLQRVANPRLHQLNDDGRQPRIFKNVTHVSVIKC